MCYTHAHVYKVETMPISNSQPDYEATRQLTNRRRSQERENVLFRLMQTMHRNEISLEELTEFINNAYRNKELSANQLVRKSHHVATSQTSGQPATSTESVRPSGRKSNSVRAQST